MPTAKKANQSLYETAGSAARRAEKTQVDGGELVSRVLESQKVKYLFAINGGHTFPILATLREHGIKLIHMRHEQACAYAADAYARTSGMPGVCSVTAGCGLTNAVTGSAAQVWRAARSFASPASIRRQKTRSGPSRKP